MRQTRDSRFHGSQDCLGLQLTLSCGVTVVEKVAFVLCSPPREHCWPFSRHAGGAAASPWSCAQFLLVSVCRPTSLLACRDTPAFTGPDTAGQSPRSVTDLPGHCWLSGGHPAYEDRIKTLAWQPLVDLCTLAFDSCQCFTTLTALIFGDFFSGQRTEGEDSIPSLGSFPRGCNSSS